MDAIGYLSGVVLAGAFVWAAIAKLRNHTETVRGFTELRVPAPAALAVAIPTIELAIVIALITAPRAGATAALVVLTALTAMLAVRLNDGPPVRCGCFGSRSDEDISFVEPLRNGLLALLAMGAMIPTAPVMPGLEDVVAVSVAVTTGLVVLGVARLVRDVRTSRQLLVFGTP